MIIKLDHIAMAVKDLESALKPYTEALGLTVSKMEEIQGQQVRIAYLPIGDTEIELVEPTTDDSGVAKFLEKRGEGLHHICLEVDDLKATLTRLKAQGVRLIDEEPHDGGKGKRIAFVHPRSMNGVLIELTEG
ncbi:MAG: methylmalonyl-CoA epimerase [Chloroflexota bacterium]|nr:methylmalonyl-CoA epimerase [Anaerolineae bacterium]